MDSQNFDVVRALDSVPVLRTNGNDGSLGTLAGHFSVFNTWYEVNSVWEGNFLERVAPGAFKNTITEDRSAMRVLFDHGYDPQIGNKVLGPITALREDKRGAAYEVPLYNTSYNQDLLPGLKDGQYGASFRFRVRGESWNDEPGVSAHNPKGIPERTITDTKVMEFGPVTFGANPDATAGVRSLTDQFYDRLKERDASAYADAARAAGRINVTTVGASQTITLPYLQTTAGTSGSFTVLTGQPGARSAGGGDTATDDEGSESVASPESAARYRALQLIGVIK